MSDKPDKGVSRRELLTFWRRSLQELDEIRAPTIQPPAPTMSAPQGWPLRPPGTTSERHLLDTCVRCGQCVAACPAQCIVPLPPAFGVATGTPAIDPVFSPCVLCDGLQCTKVCPSGALKPVDDLLNVKMGTAHVDPALCVTYHGQACPACYMTCPIPGAIVRADDGRVSVGDTCTGCGLCEHVCPTEPKAIHVVPAGFVA